LLQDATSRDTDSRSARAQWRHEVGQCTTGPLV